MRKTIDKEFSLRERRRLLKFEPWSNLSLHRLTKGLQKGVFDSGHLRLELHKLEKGVRSEAMKTKNNPEQRGFISALKKRFSK